MNESELNEKQSTNQSLPDADCTVWSQIDEIECGRSVKGRAVISFHKGGEVVTVILDRNHIDFLLERLSEIQTNLKHANR